MMRVSIVLVGALATVMALTSDSVYGLWFLSSDLVYVILFPQLVCVVYLKDRVNTYGSLAAYIVGCVLRAGGGEKILGIPPFIKYPFFDGTEQQFPFRTFSMIASFITLLAVSEAFTWLFAGGRAPKEWDVFKCFTSTPPKAEEAAVPKVVGGDLKAPSKTATAEKPAPAAPAKAPAMPSSAPEKTSSAVKEDAMEKLSTASRRSSKTRRRSVGGPPADEKTATGLTESGSDARRKQKKRRKSATSKTSDKSDHEGGSRSDGGASGRSKKRESSGQLSASGSKTDAVRL